METTTETPQMAKVVKVSKGQISTLLEVFKYIGFSLFVNRLNTSLLFSC
jgi:hypothetical protein